MKRLDGKYNNGLRIAKTNALFDQTIIFIEDILKDDKKTNKQKVEEVEDLMLSVFEMKEKFD